jgi:hypothetical protein
MIYTSDEKRDLTNTQQRYRNKDWKLKHLLYRLFSDSQRSLWRISRRSAYLVVQGNAYMDAMYI